MGGRDWKMKIEDAMSTDVENSKKQNIILNYSVIKENFFECLKLHLIGNRLSVETDMHCIY